MRRKSATFAEALAEHRRKTGALGPLDGDFDIVFDSSEMQMIGCVVEYGVGGARVAIARLADAPGIDQPAIGVAQIDHRRTAARARAVEGELAVRVAEEDEAGFCAGEHVAEGVGAEEILVAVVR